MNELEKAKWLVFDDGDAHMTRTRFLSKQVKSAEIAITALGYFHAYINGKSITDDRFIPAFTDYEKRDLSKINMPIFDTFSHRIYYQKYDVTNLVQNGENVLACHIGAGWYGQHKSRNEGMPKWGDNTLVFRLTLEYANGETEVICSDTANTKWLKSYVREASLYFGETVDYNYYSPLWMMPEYDDAAWHICSSRIAPEAEIQLADFTPDREVESIEPTLIYQFGDTKIYDMGKEYAGYAVAEFDEDTRANSIVVTRYADALNEDGSLQFHYVGGMYRMQRDVFICGDDNERDLIPHFTWHAARYVELTGQAKVVRFAVINTDIKQTGFFTCDNETLNWFFEAYIRTQSDNTHGCIPSDCPHRERLGYTGDGQLASGAVMSVFDARKMYKKWMRDIFDCQDKVGGHVQHTAPFYGGGGGPGGWGGAVCIVPMRYYEYYNDLSMLEDSYEPMKAYIGYMVRHTEDGIVTHEEKGGWCLGDWCAPHNDIKIPEAFVNTYYLAKCSEITAKTAELLGNTQDVPVYLKIAEDAKQALCRHYFDAKTGSFCVDETGYGVQGADAFAVDIGIGDARTLKQLAEKYNKLKCFDTGIFGTDILIRVLFRNQYASLAFELLTNETENSFYNMKKGGATTLWENWDGCDSRCHPMFGAVTEYLFTDVLGIQRYQNKPGFAEIVIQPAFIPQLKHVKGEMHTQDGNIFVEIDTDENGKRSVNYRTQGNIRVIQS